MRWSRSGVIVRRGLHLLRHISTVQNVIGLSSAESEYDALTKGLGGVLRIGSAKLVCRLEPEATTLIAYGLFERQGSCFAKRSWHEHSTCTDEDAMATGTCSSKTPASCGKWQRSQILQTSRHTDWSDRTSCEDGGTRNPRNFKKLKKVKFCS